MKPLTLGRVCAALLSLGLASWPATASACSVCMGNPGTKTAGAINGAIFLLMGFIGCVLSGLAAFGISLMKKASAPIAPHGELAQMINPSKEVN